MPQARDEAGNIWETDAQGNAVRLVTQAGAQQAPKGGVFALPPSPLDQARESRAGRAEDRAGRAEARAGQAEGRAQTALIGELYQKGLRPSANGGVEPIPGWTPPASIANRPTLTAKERADALAAYQSAEALDRFVSDLRTKFASGPGSTSGISGYKDYLPTEENRQFDAAGNAARGIVGTALGFTGGQLNTATEAEAAVGPYLPQASDRDDVIRDKISRLEAIAQDARQRSVAILGGVPDANGSVTPVPAQNAMAQTYMSRGGPMAAAASGATTKQGEIPQAMQREYDAWIAQNAGNLNPDSYVKFRTGLDAKYGYPADPAKTEEYRGWAERNAQKARTGGTIQTRIPGPTEPMSRNEIQRNNLVNNPEMAALVGALDAGGFGGVSALAPEKMAALGDQNGTAMAIGQIGGSIGATSALGKGAREIFSKLSPRMLQGGGKGAFARNLATDAVYGTITGSNQGLDPTSAALASTVGSLGGQAVGKGIGSGLAGINLAPAVQALRNQGIRLTTGQMLGGSAKSIEDAMTSLPGVGDMVNARRLEGFQDFNRAMFNKAGEPIGKTVGGVGEQGVNDLLGQQGQPGLVSNAYDAATAGVRLPLDQQFAIDMAAARAAGAKLPSDYADKFNLALNNRVGPIETAGELTGDTYQQGVRGLKSYRAETTKPGFEQDYRDALSQGMDALTGQMQRGGGQQVVQGLANADQAYRGAKTLQRAVQAAKNGTGTGEIQIFTPAQANTAATQAANKYGGPRQFGDLIDAGQTVLPSQLPDSGTGRRLVQTALGGGLIGAGAGAGYAGGDVGAGTLSSAALLGALALGGTRAGQNLFNKLLADRPMALKAVGRKIGKRGGLFGSAAVPLTLESGK